MPFAVKEFKSKRAKQRLWGNILFWGGLFLLVLDLFTPFPFRGRGMQSIWEFWLFLIGCGIYLQAISRKLPIEETLEIAREHNGELKVNDLISELEVTISTAERILRKIVRMGYARVERRSSGDEQEVRVWKFPELTR